MAVRRFLVGDPVHTVELGPVPAGLGRVSQTALISEVTGTPELFLERRSRLAFLSASVRYIHIPFDGIDAIEAVADQLEAGALPAPTRLEQTARSLLRLSTVPLKLCLVAFMPAWLWFALAELTGGSGIEGIASEPGPETMFAVMGVFFSAVALHRASLWLSARALNEAIDPPPTPHPLRLLGPGTP